MKRYEQLKLFSGITTEAIERNFNEWYREKKDERLRHSALVNFPFTILHREFIIKQDDGVDLFALAIFYEDYDLEIHEQGAVNKTNNLNGASMFPCKK